MKPTSFKSKTTPWRVQVPGRYFPDGKRKAKYFETRSAADDFCKKLKRFGASALGEQPVAASQDADRFGALMQMALAKLGNDPGQLFQAIEHFEKTRLNLTAMTVRQAVEEFQRIRAAKVKPVTLDADRWRLIKLFDPFEKKQIADITAADLRQWFDKLGAKINTRSVHKSVRKFFGDAKKYNWIAENPMLEIEPEDEFGVNNEVYTPDVFDRMLRIAAGLEAPKAGKEPTRDFIDLLGWFVISGFCGLRTGEAYRKRRNAEAIRWSDLFLDRGFIDIRKEVAKPKTPPRHIERPHALAAAKAWFELVRCENDFIVPWTHRKMQELKREFTKATGIKFVKNGLRNSFASYALTYTGLDGVGKLALEMGNSEAICKKHYIKRLEPGSGKAWFGLRPAPENVISISAAA